MDDIYYQSLLFDFYGELLTEKQREIMKLYKQEDLSLGEIGDLLKISRQGVSDAIHRSLSSMQQVENKLHMIERYVRLSHLAEDLEKKICQDEPKDEVLASVLQLKDTIAISNYQE